MPARFTAWLFIAIGVLASWPARAVVGQELALAARSPQFFYVSDASARPVEVDVKRTAALRQVVSLKVERPTVGLLLAAIEEQTGLTFAYDNDFQPDRPVTLWADSIAVASALAGMLYDTGVNVVLSAGGHVALVKRPPAPPTGSINGRVTNAQSGEVLEGVEVHLQGTQWRALTGTDGQYRLADVDTGTYVVTARRIGYTRQSRSVTVAEGQEATADFALQPVAAKLGELIVTAQKREERLQDVPMSIAVVTPEEIDRRGLVGAEDYLRGIPGSNQMEDPFGGSIVIRGIESITEYQNLTVGPTVATYFGEAPTTTSAGIGNNANIDLKLVDIERVEVLRGPQGTAFGNMALGGAVRVIPVAPKLDRFEGKLRGGYSETSGTGGDNYDFQAVGNFPLIRDKLALRAVGYRYENSGFYRNRAGSDPAFQAQVVEPYGAEAFATDEEGVGATRFIGGHIAALFRPNDHLRFTLNYLRQKTETDGWPVANSGTYEQTIFRVPPEHIYRGQAAGVADFEIDIANAVMEYELGWASLLASYSYVKSGSVYVWPWSLYGLGWDFSWPLAGPWDADNRAHVGEVRLATRLDGAWNFLAGVYAEDDKEENLYGYTWNGDPATNPLNPGQTFVSSAFARRTLKQLAAFGEASWEFLPGLTLTGGMRAYQYERFVGNESIGALGTTPFLGQTTDKSGTKFRTNLSYKPADNAHLYAGWAEGVRFGRPQRGAPDAICDTDNDGLIDGTDVTIASTQVVNPDGVDSYEVGGKFALLDRRLSIDAAVFHIDWSDIPASTFISGSTAPGCFPVYAINAGAARSEGIEFQAKFRLTDALRIDLGGSRINARLTKDAPGAGFEAGMRLPGTPKLNANLALQYDFDFGGRAAIVRADAIYSGTFYADLKQSPNTKAGGYVRFDASARVKFRDVNVDFFIRNVTNENAFVMRESAALGLEDVFGYRLRPRTIGAQFSYDF